MQYDGVTTQTARTSMDIIKEMFSGNVISQGDDLSWLPRSSDIPICNYFLWDYLKEKVFFNKPCTPDEFKTVIFQEILEYTTWCDTQHAMLNFHAGLKERASKKIRSIWIMLFSSWMNRYYVMHIYIIQFLNMQNSPEWF